MIVCDRCKRIPKSGRHEPFLYEITGSKMEETKVGKKGTAAGREIVKITMHLCDGCITHFNRDLGGFINGVRNNDTVEVDRDLSEPVGVTEREFGHNDERVQANAEKLANRGLDDPTLMANEGFVSPVK